MCVLQQLEKLLQDSGIELPGGSQTKLYAQQYMDKKTELDKLEHSLTTLRRRIQTQYPAPSLGSTTLSPSSHKESVPLQQSSDLKPYPVMMATDCLSGFDEDTSNSSVILGQDVALVQSMDIDSVFSPISLDSTYDAFN